MIGTNLDPAKNDNAFGNMILWKRLCNAATPRPTIISTNLTNEEYNAKYNERIVSRLTGCFMPIMFVGNDIRHVKLKNNL